MENKITFPGKTVLVAEDYESNYYLLETILKTLDIKVLWVKDGDDAIESCLSNPDIDLVLMDIKMPNLNGYKATEQIKEKRPDLPIIAQTAYALYGDDLKAEEAGCDAYIPKPIRRKKLIELLVELLDK
jgi:CheY-like chemotaxis protein